MAENDVETREPETDVPDGKKDALASLAGQIATLSTGDRARLRRMMLTRSAGADGVVIGLLRRAGVSDAGWRGDAVFARWRLIAHVAAVLSGTGGHPAHSPIKQLGRALFAAGYSENRFMRLTSARGDALTAQVIRAARFLAQAGAAPVNLHTLNALLSDRPDRAEAARLKLARDYYSAQYAEEKEAQ